MHIYSFVSWIVSSQIHYKCSENNQQPEMVQTNGIPRTATSSTTLARVTKVCDIADYIGTTMHYHNPGSSTHRSTQRLERRKNRDQSLPTDLVMSAPRRYLQYCNYPCSHLHPREGRKELLSTQDNEVVCRARCKVKRWHLTVCLPET